MKSNVFLVIGALSIVQCACVSQVPTGVANAPRHPVIHFEDSTDKAGIHFTHSFGSRQLGSLLEGNRRGMRLAGL